MRRLARRILRNPFFVAGCAALAICAIALQVVPLASAFFVAPGRWLELGFGSGGIWIWVAGLGDFEVHRAGVHAVEVGLPQAWAPEFRVDRGMVITDSTLRRSSVVNGVFLHLPSWIVAVALAVPPALWASRRRRRRPGCCACGYDLSGLRDLRCPECGREIGV